MFEQSLYLSSHFDIMLNGSIVEFPLSGKYVVLYFNNDHKIVDRDIWIL